MVHGGGGVLATCEKARVRAPSPKGSFQPFELEIGIALVRRYVLYI